MKPSLIICSLGSMEKHDLSLLIFILCGSVMLSGCDYDSSTAPSSAKSASIQSETSQSSDMDVKESAIDPNPDNNNQTFSSINRHDQDKDLSVLATAETEDLSYRPRSPMISDAHDDDDLQATLMGDYAGKLPCSFCDNIQVTLNLFADGSVAKTSVYNNATPVRKPANKSGVYRQDAHNITIVYQNKNIEKYRIQDNHLIMLDKQGKPDEDYTLSRL